MASNGGTVVECRGLTKPYQVLKDVQLMDMQVKECLREIDAVLERLKGDKKGSALDLVMQAQYDRMQSIERVLADQETTLRKEINILSRPYVRRVQLLDMPDEILMTIFGILRPWGHEEEQKPRLGIRAGTSEVKNLRLTSRRICATSSHLLVRFLQVDCSDSSLSHFEEISRHPIISKGVRVVRVDLYFYDSMLANDIWTFLQHHRQKLRENVDYARYHLGNTSDLQKYNMSKEILLQRISQGDMVLDSWQAMVSDDPEDCMSEEVLSHRMMIRRCHEEYQGRFADQERLRQGGIFVQAVASAMARMPLARQLEVQDENYRRDIREGTTYYKELSDQGAYAAIVKSMLIPLHWSEARDNGLGQPPVDMLFKLLGALYKAGVFVTNLQVNLSPPEDFSTLAPQEEDFQDIISAAQRIKRFDFRGMEPDCQGWPGRNFGELEALRRFLSALLDTESVEEIRLDLSFLRLEDWILDPACFSIGPIINNRPWQQLKSLHLESINFHFAELEQFTARCGAQMHKLCIENSHLRSGTWADCLDILSQNAPCGKIGNPSGAECDVLSDEEVEAIFGSGSCTSEYSQYTDCNLYIRGRLPKNPLRDSPDSELSESSEEFSDPDDELSDVN